MILSVILNKDQGYESWFIKNKILTKRGFEYFNADKMDYMNDRTWMYKRRDTKGVAIENFYKGVDCFLKFATEDFAHENIRCPCSKCDIRKFQDINTAKLHLYQWGFISNYTVWKFHGEVAPRETLTTIIQHDVESVDDPTHSYIPDSRMEEMIFDGAGPVFHELMENIESITEEPPNPEAQAFFDLLKSAHRPLWEGCTTHTELSATARFIAIKSKHNSSESAFDDYIQATCEMLPPDNVLKDSYRQIKKLVAAFGLPYEKIDTCRNGCMLYWKDDKELTCCKFCEAVRFEKKRKGKNVSFKKLIYFPLIPRLQRLYASKATSAHMRWHAIRPEEGEFLCHPSDGEAWKHFDQTFPDFAKETRNVRLGLCTDGFAPFNKFGKRYSSWPVILTPYNLPPWMCMKDPYMFLTLIVPGPKDPGKGIDVYLQPLIDELIFLWNNGFLRMMYLPRNFLLCELPCCGQLAPFLLLECYLVGAQLVDYLVLVAWSGQIPFI